MFYSKKKVHILSTIHFPKYENWFLICDMTLLVTSKPKPFSPVILFYMYKMELLRLRMFQHEPSLLECE